jgi:hypothetical protein
MTKVRIGLIKRYHDGYIIRYIREIITGYKYTKEGITVILHKNGNGWGISEPSTGMAFGKIQSLPTRKLAQQYADQVIADVGVDKIREAMDRQYAYVSKLQFMEVK